jgi:hypothetical protein
MKKGIYSTIIRLSWKILIYYSSSMANVPSGRFLANTHDCGPDIADICALPTVYVHSQPSARSGRISNRYILNNTCFRYTIHGRWPQSRSGKPGVERAPRCNGRDRTRTTVARSSPLDVDRYASTHRFPTYLQVTDRPIAGRYRPAARHRRRVAVWRHPPDGSGAIAFADRLPTPDRSLTAVVFAVPPIPLTSRGDQLHSLGSAVERDSSPRRRTTTCSSARRSVRVTRPGPRCSRGRGDSRSATRRRPR